MKQDFAKFLDEIDDEKFIVVSFKEKEILDIEEYLEGDPEPLMLKEEVRPDQEYDIYIITEGESTYDFAFLERSVVRNYPKNKLVIEDM